MQSLFGFILLYTRLCEIDVSFSQECQALE